MRKGQMQLMENVFAVFILIIIGLVVLVIFAYSALNNSNNDYSTSAKMQALITARSVYNMPEVQCTILGDAQDKCVDIIKAANFSRIATSGPDSVQATYFNYFGYAVINLTCFDCEYPEDKAVQTITLYSRPKKGSSAYSYQLPVLVKNPVNDTLRFGYLNVISYK